MCCSLCLECSFYFSLGETLFILLKLYVLSLSVTSLVKFSSSCPPELISSSQYLKNSNFSRVPVRKSFHQSKNPGGLFHSPPFPHPRILRALSLPLQCLSDLPSFLVPTAPVLAAAVFSLPLQMPSSSAFCLWTQCCARLIF